MKYFLSIACIFKNEEHALDEFILHHIHHGVDHFYMINDFSSDDSVRILEKYSNVVTLFNNDIITSETGRQEYIYEKYLRGIINETEWLAIIDSDEFMYTVDTLDLKNVLKGENGFKIFWKTFGSNNCYFQPLSIVSGFTKHRADMSKGGSFKHVFKTKYLIKFGIHMSDLSTHTCDSYDIIINHYQNQSLRFYLDVKSTRGDVNNWFPNNGLVRDINNFNFYDDNDIECRILYNQNKEIIKKVKELKLENLKGTKEVTVVLTACNRPHLLRRTIDSFLKFNTNPIKEFIIVEDSDKIGINDFLKSEYPKEKWNLIYNGYNRGQIESIDIAYEYVMTEYIFHCEDDWEFKNHGFIEKSIHVLEHNENILMVWLRNHNCTNGHPINYEECGEGYFLVSNNFTYESMGTYYTWGGFSFNPGLRRTKDALLFHPYSVNVKPFHDMVDEYAINLMYLKSGFRSAILYDKDGYLEHIGFGEHIDRFHEKDIHKTINNCNYHIENDLCKIMDKMGSDKGSKNHHYTRLYNELFKDIRYKKLNVFELGIGTKNPNIPSSMASCDYSKPGGSLHGWRDYFINSQIFGADIDTDILFKEDRIKTFFVNQLEKESIEEMWEKIGKDVKFDIIIDDGLHTEEANHTFLINSYSQLKKNGIYIIEDLNIPNYNLMNEYEKIFRQVSFVMIPDTGGRLYVMKK
jgi:hypothetical protein